MSIALSIILTLAFFNQVNLILMNGFIMCIIKCVSARRNLYLSVKFAAHLYLFFNYTETARMIERLFVPFLVESKQKFSTCVISRESKIPMKSISIKSFECLDIDFRESVFRRRYIVLN